MYYDTERRDREERVEKHPAEDLEAEILRHSP
jgi:hypothetical protein